MKLLFFALASLCAQCFGMNNNQVQPTTTAPSTNNPIYVQPNVLLLTPPSPSMQNHSKPNKINQLLQSDASQGREKRQRTH